MSEEYTPFKMKGSPAKTGGIQGTSSHASALKQRSMTKTVKPIKRMNRTIEDKKFKKEVGPKTDRMLLDRIRRAEFGTLNDIPGKKPKAKNWNEKLTKLTDKRAKLKEKQDAREDAGKGTKTIDWRVKRNQKKINKEMKKAGN